MATSVKDLISKATARENAPRKSGKPVFLFLKKGHKALIRPLFSLDEAITLPVHNKWSDTPDYRVNAICATEIGKPCLHCETAKELEDKKLNASPVIFLPVYVYSVIDTLTGAKVTYTEKDEHDNQVEKPVSGFRVLELSLFGKPLMILQALMSHERDEDVITSCDFSLEQQGEGQKKNFLTNPKAPKPIDPRIKSACPDITKFHEAILGARPPAVASESPLAGVVEQSDSVASDEIEVNADDGIAVF